MDKFQIAIMENDILNGNQIELDILEKYCMYYYWELSSGKVVSSRQIEGIRVLLNKITTTFSTGYPFMNAMRGRFLRGPL